MQLTDEQKQAVKKWAAEGSNLSDIQKKLAAEFGLGLTYMDVRLLMLDIDCAVKDKKAPPPPAPKGVSSAKPIPLGVEDEADMDPADLEADDFSAGAGAPAAGGLGSVSVEVSRLTRPGSIVSGSVTFSDGVKAEWSLDQMGRLGLTAGKQGYRPSEPDIQAFQLELRRVLSTKGY